MTKFKMIEIKAEMISSILENFHWQSDCYPKRVKEMEEIIETKKKEALENGEEPDIDYYLKELEEAQIRVKFYDEIVKHLEKLF